ncbi:hypothetical protein SADUNF_Sadunf05G0180200 [Salix dunnii]|uniref:E2F/DP family winged-helix DNA-binding domain-containing protein n=1 Tax=Salix dunnii TaxID=1413687 RepID=A0A835KBY3_9ROSI|nr:hypothetical protein SADUNF_Sadunf05G0180200 [Salix dunnii]
MDLANHSPRKLGTKSEGDNPEFQTTRDATIPAQSDMVTDLTLAVTERLDAGMLTKKFVKLTQEAQDGTIDLKKNCRSVGGMEKESFMCYARMLLNKRIELLTLEGSHKVQKRRIYDTTNILEGIGFIEEYFKKPYALEVIRLIFFRAFSLLTAFHSLLKLKVCTLQSSNEVSRSDGIKYCQPLMLPADIEDFASWMASSSLLQRTSRELHDVNENQAAGRIR